MDPNYSAPNMIRDGPANPLRQTMPLARELVTLFSVSFACFVASLAGLILSKTPVQSDILWPANGLLLAVLLLSPQKRWAGLLTAGFCASLLAHILFRYSSPMAALYAGANMLEVSIAAVAMTWRSPQATDLMKLRSFVRFIVFAVVLAPLCSDLVIALQRADPFSRVNRLDFYDWFIGDSLGIAIMTPLIFALNPLEIKFLLRPEARIKTIVALAAYALVNVAIFAQRSYPISFLILLALLVLIFHLGQSGAAVGVLLTAVISSWLTVDFRGPFSQMRAGTFFPSIVILQFFLCILLITVYTVSTALSERDQLQEELIAAYREADEMAGRDHLTGLANRRSFDRQLLREWRRAARERTSISLIMIDIDFFKKYNDSHGHIAGDACLQRISSVLASCLYRTTDFIARFGGEEFVIILPATDPEGALLIAERLRGSIAALKMDRAPNGQDKVTISAGVSTFYPTLEIAFHDLEQNELLKRADDALYSAKQRGRNQVVTWKDQLTPIESDRARSSISILSLEPDPSNGRN
ncbi:diguanylate cyclase [Granulicella sp. dw_53]|uniref:GGDEF domain-containing protein n=1 Tax=Granulicella sp. dw_53 TaxID=2719792 RepID=UPI001BD2AF68|nr:diguanylate cyclase [Granulicella sp. dw_53]